MLRPSRSIMDVRVLWSRLQGDTPASDASHGCLECFVHNRQLPMAPEGEDDPLLPPDLARRQEYIVGDDVTTFMRVPGNRSAPEDLRREAWFRPLVPEDDRHPVRTRPSPPRADHAPELAQGRVRRAGLPAPGAPLQRELTASPVLGSGRLILRLYVVGSHHGYLVAGASHANVALFGRTHDCLRLAALGSGMEMWTKRRDAMLANLLQICFPTNGLLEIISRDVW